MVKEKLAKISWSGLQSLIWLVGIGILFITNDWLPGILLVIATSLLAALAQHRLARS